MGTMVGRVIMPVDDWDWYQESGIEAVVGCAIVPVSVWAPDIRGAGMGRWFCV